MRDFLYWSGSASGMNDLDLEVAFSVVGDIWDSNGGKNYRMFLPGQR
jgi:hypothetical protein